jgi:hypothetical protein
MATRELAGLVATEPGIREFVCSERYRHWYYYSDSALRLSDASFSMVQTTTVPMGEFD